MRQKTVYLFDELNEVAQQNAIEQNRDINIDYEWWDMEYSMFIDELEKIGVTCKTFYFSLDRAWYIFMENPYVQDERKFLKFCGFDLRTKFARDILREETHYLEIQNKHYSGGRQENYVKVTLNDLSGWGEYNEDLTQCLKEKLYDFLNRLREEYEYLSSYEAIAENLSINMCEFTAEGDLA
jgi:hypothetical protein